MLARLVVGAGLFALGYYLGKEVGRMAPVRDELRRARNGERPQPAAPDDTTPDESVKDEVPGDRE